MGAAGDQAPGGLRRSEKVDRALEASPVNRTTRRRLPVLALLCCTPLFVSYSAHVGAEHAGADTGSGASAAVCEAPADAQARLQQRLARAAELARGSQAAHDVIVLNGQGYNYAAAGSRQLEQIQREQARQQGRDPAAQ